MTTSWPMLSFSAAQITAWRMHARTHTRTSTSRSISRFPLLNALHQKHSSASPPSLQSCSPANNNVELDSADPSESETSANVEGMKRPKSPSDTRTSRVLPMITHCQTMQDKKMILSHQGFFGFFSPAPTQMTEDFFWSWVSVSSSPSMVKYITNPSFSASRRLFFYGKEQGKWHSHINWQRWIRAPKKTGSIFTALQRIGRGWRVKMQRSASSVC